MAEATYRPRSVAELIDAAVQLFRRNYSTLIAITAIGYIPWFAASTLASHLWGSPPQAMSLDNLGDYSVQIVVGGLGVLWSSVVSAGCIAAASDAYLGGEPQVGPALRRALARALPIIATTLVTALAAAVGLFMFIIGGLYFYARYVLSWTVALLEGRGVPDSLSRAARLSRGNKLRILGTMGAVWFIYFALALAVGLTAELISPAPLERLIQAAFTILLSPLIGVATAVLYYDLRIRNEGFDVELLERQMGASEPTAPV